MPALALEFACEPSALVAAREEVRGHLLRAGVDEPARNAVDLALDELLGNTIRYGTSGRPCRARVELSRARARLLLALEDDAQAFDPTRHPEPERPASLACARIGGLGISMVRRVTLAMRYARERGRNRLELEIPLDGQGSGT